MPTPRKRRMGCIGGTGGRWDGEEERIIIEQ